QNGEIAPCPTQLGNVVRGGELNLTEDERAGISTYLLEQLRRKHNLVILVVGPGLVVRLRVAQRILSWLGHAVSSLTESAGWIPEPETTPSLHTPIFRIGPRKSSKELPRRRKTRGGPSLRLL